MRLDETGTIAYFQDRPLVVGWTFSLLLFCLVRNDSRREIYSRGGAWSQRLVVPTSTLAPSGFQ